MGRPEDDRDKNQSLSPDASRRSGSKRSSWNPFSASSSSYGAAGGSGSGSGSGFSLTRALSNRSLGRGGSSSRRPRGSSPPPAYSEAVAGTGTGTGTGDRATFVGEDGEEEEDRYWFLSKYDTVFLIDDSTSMRTCDDRQSRRHRGGGMTRWDETREALAAIVPVCTARDADGVDVYFLNHMNPAFDRRVGGQKGGYLGVNSADAVNGLFARVAPAGGTPTGGRLGDILKPYLRVCEDAAAAKAKDEDGEEPAFPKPLNLIVVTDGEAGDDPDVVLLEAARRLDRCGAPLDQVGVQFFQVGRSRDATEALRWLDDELGRQHDVRDMVDTVTFDLELPNAGYEKTNDPQQQPTLTADGVLKAVLGSVIKRLDRMPQRQRGGSSSRPGR
ncbi:hypothetical protein GGR56DRAFT_26032 [Xylariaceae sp. FL0804]|nr:hypothetical protein GGR56DRAFT_26032 [Xylariaceae sp. FL0804]